MADFWQMIWEQKVDVIAMLTALEEQGKPKCHRYWPEKQGTKHKVNYGQVCFLRVDLVIVGETYTKATGQKNRYPNIMSTVDRHVLDSMFQT